MVSKYVVIQNVRITSFQALNSVYYFIIILKKRGEEEKKTTTQKKEKRSEAKFSFLPSLSFPLFFLTIDEDMTKLSLLEVLR